MSDEWNWGQEPEKTDGSSQQPENTDESGSAASDQTAAPEDELNENVTYHYKYTSSRNSDGAGSRQWKLLRFQQQFRYFPEIHPKTAVLSPTFGTQICALSG